MEEKEGGRIGAPLNNLTIETAGKEEEATEDLKATLGMEVEDDKDSEGEKGGGGTIRALGALEFLTQDAEQCGITLVDARNVFNEMIRLAMLWNVRHCWPAGVTFAFNCYRYLAQLLLRQSGEPPVTILIIEGVTQGEPFSMVLYSIILFPLAKELRAAEPGLLSPFYADDVAYDDSLGQSTQLLKLLMKKGPDRGYFP